MPGRPHLSTPGRIATAGLVAAVALSCAACGAVKVAVPQLPAQVTDQCSRLVAALPETVSGQTRRSTSPKSPLIAAWGKPPIVATCGVPTPVSASSGAACYEVNGVGWYADEQPQQVTFTTVGRRLNLEVVVGSAFAPQADVLIDLAAAVKAHDPVVRPCSG